MNTADTEAAIVVGVGRHGHLSDGTISFVVETAERLRLGVELLHVVPNLLGGPTGTWEVGISFDHLVEDGREGLDVALARVRSRAAENQPVTAELVRGGVVASLLDRSKRAQLVVLERRQLGRWERLADGSVTAGVAARAHSPVVSVPQGWHPSPDPQPITVAVEDAERAESEIWTALGLAAASDVPLTVLRATYLPEAYQEILRREATEDDFLLAAGKELACDARLPEDVRERIPCTFEVRWGRAADVLVDASRESSLLVVARRDPLVPFGSHLGPVVRHVLSAAECPVMVVEPTLTQLVSGQDSTPSAGPLPVASS